MIEFNTIHWLPKHLARMEEWQEICKAYDYLLSKAWAAMEVFYANQSLETLTVAGCEIWEKLLGITLKESDTLEERRFRILSWWSQELPYTLPKLNERLTALCGKDGYEIFEDFTNYLMTFEIKLENRENINSIVDMLDRMLPANIVRNIWLVSDSNIDSGWGVAAVDVLDQEEHLTNDINIDNPDQAYPYTASMAVYDFAEGIEEMTIIGMGTQTDTETAAEYGKAAAMVYDSEQTIGG